LDAALQYLTCGNNNDNNNNGNNNDINKNTWDEDEPSFKIVVMFCKYTALILQRVYIVELNAFCGANVTRQITGGYCGVFIFSNNVSAV